MTVFTQQGSRIFLGSEKDSTTTPELAPGYYLVEFNPMLGGYYLSVAPPFDLPTRLYGDVDTTAERIINTFADRATKGLGTGVLAVGLKGSGKSLLAKLLAAKMVDAEYPVIAVASPFSGESFNKFVQRIEQPCCFMFDEFEKVYGRAKLWENDDESEGKHGSQEALLSLFDGTFSGRKLMILTANDKWAVDKHFINRPGRVFYCLKYGALAENFIRDYCAENLNNKDEIDSIVRLSKLIGDFNFDILQSVVEEMNRYGEDIKTALRLLNVELEPDDAFYEVKVFEMANPEVKVYANNEDHRLIKNPLMHGPITMQVFTTDNLGNPTEMKTKVTVNFAEEKSTQISNDFNEMSAQKDGYIITAKKRAGREVDYMRWI